MKTRRLLLPFTCCVNVRGIEYVVQLASSCAATLVPVALIYVPPARLARGPRLEYIEQANDFLEVVRHKASQYHISIEPCEVITSDMMQSMTTLTNELQCESVIVVVDGRREALLHTYEVKYLVEKTSTPLLFIHLPLKQKRLPTSLPDTQRGNLPSPFPLSLEKFLRNFHSPHTSH